MSKKNQRQCKKSSQKDATSVKPAKSEAAKSTTAADRIKSAKKVGFLSRRHALKLLIGVPAVGVAGAAIHRHDVQNRGLHDLSSIGQGQAVVVQIHDPACQLCRRLMNNTRKALKNRDDVLFRVADIKTNEGASFQKQHSVPTVSLLLFNESGRRVGAIQGVTPIDELKEQFAHL